MAAARLQSFPSEIGNAEGPPPVDHSPPTFHPCERIRSECLDKIKPSPLNGETRSLIRAVWFLTK